MRYIRIIYFFYLKHHRVKHLIEMMGGGLNFGVFFFRKSQKKWAKNRKKMGKKKNGHKKWEKRKMAINFPLIIY